MSVAAPLRHGAVVPFTRPPRVSVVIKALNEERHIRASIESAVAADHGLAGVVAAADSRRVAALGRVEAAPIPYHGRRYSLNVTLPPLGAVFFTSEVMLEQS